MSTITKVSKIFIAILFILSVNPTFSNPISTENTTTLQSLEVKNQAEQVILAWKFEESIVSNVYVQRAGADMQFVSISNLSITDINQFTDKQPQAGISFYRLVTKYSDGTIMYHKVVTISR